MKSNTQVWLKDMNTETENTNIKNSVSSKQIVHAHESCYFVQYAKKNSSAEWLQKSVYILQPTHER